MLPLDGKFLKYFYWICSYGVITSIFDTKSMEVPAILRKKMMNFYSIVLWCIGLVHYALWKQLYLVSVMNYFVMRCSSARRGVNSEQSKMHRHHFGHLQNMVCGRYYADAGYNTNSNQDHLNIFGEKWTYVKRYTERDMNVNTMVEWWNTFYNFTEFNYTHNTCTHRNCYFSRFNF